MTENTKRRATGWTVDTLLIGLAIIVAIAFITTGRRAEAAEVIIPSPDVALGCYTYAGNTAAYTANGQEWAPLTKGEIIVASSLAKVDAASVTRGFMVRTGYPVKPWAVGLEVAGCLLPKPMWVESPAAIGS